MSPRLSIRPLGAQSDQRLAQLAREGHERAFEALVQRYRRPLLRYARRMRLSEARAEDVLQQSFLNSWLALSRGVHVRDVRSWLYRIVHNTAMNAMRGPAEGHRELTEAVQDRAALSGSTQLERTIALRDALGQVATLPPLQRDAVVLTALDGQSHEQAAGTLGVSTGAVRGLLYRARSTLRSAAAAVIPQPLLEALAAPSAEQIAGAGACARLAGAGILAKGAAIALTAGALLTSAISLEQRRHPPAPASHRSMHPDARAQATAPAAPERAPERARTAVVAPSAPPALRLRRPSAKRPPREPARTSPSTWRSTFASGDPGAWRTGRSEREAGEDRGTPSLSLDQTRSSHVPSSGFEGGDGVRPGARLPSRGSRDGGAKDGGGALASSSAPARVWAGARGSYGAREGDHAPGARARGGEGAGAGSARDPSMQWHDGHGEGPSSQGDG